MAVWALGRLLDEAAFQALKAAHRDGETDADVLAEWDRASASATATADHAEAIAR
jgi:hypothetical protein